MRTNRRKIEKSTAVRVLCVECSKWFDTPRSCLEVSNWDRCMECLDKESAETRKLLAKRGIVI